MSKELPAEYRNSGFLEEVKAKISAIEQDADEEIAAESPEQKDQLKARFNLLMGLFLSLSLMEFARTKAFESVTKLPAPSSAEPQNIANELSLINKTEMLFKHSGEPMLWGEGANDVATKITRHLLPENFMGVLEAAKRKALNFIKGGFDSKFYETGREKNKFTDSRLEDSLAFALSSEISSKFFESQKFRLEDLAAVSRNLNLIFKDRALITKEDMNMLNEGATSMLADFLRTALKKPYLIYAYAEERNLPIPDDKKLKTLFIIAEAVSKVFAEDPNTPIKKDYIN